MCFTHLHRNMSGSEYFSVGKKSKLPNSALLHFLIYYIGLSYISQLRNGRAGKGNHMNCGEKKDEGDEIPLYV